MLRNQTRLEENNLSVRERQALVEQWSKYIHQIARHYGRAFHANAILQEDINQEAFAGACRAAKVWDPQKSKFNSYVTSWCKAYILRFLQENIRGDVKPGKPRDSNLPELEAVKCFSLDQPIHTNNNIEFSNSINTISELVAGNDSTPEQIIQEKQIHEAYIEAVKLVTSGMSRKYKEIAEKRLINEDDFATLKDLGYEYGVTRERVRQYQSKVIKNLVPILKERLGLPRSTRTKLPKIYFRQPVLRREN